MRTTTTALVALLLALTLTSCTEDEEPENEPLPISSMDFPDGQWPFTVDAGYLSCEEVSVGTAILLEAGGTIYVLNGPATILAEEMGWARMHLIWADAPGGGQGKIPTSAVEQYAKEHC
ncbi:YebY family protein [Streptomyces sp. ST2-7A]|uniref:YebY family protein n=1 Tax=Streptomyces sp. ST2-7A TaxID=2907214 RepID=UPI001F4833B0|nr:YebY family protein [Streptomyces sp. ST2-7A]MCE7080503.1 YebY family protein [Streptomyces sp. ST2-7A]